MVELESIVSDSCAGLSNFKSKLFNKISKYVLITATSAMLFASCSKDEPLPDPIPEDNKITISGVVSNNPHSAHPTTYIEAISKDGVFLGKDVTDNNGEYSLTLGDEVESFNLTYKSSNHEFFDTTITAWRNHNINKELQVKGK